MPEPKANETHEMESISVLLREARTEARNRALEEAAVVAEQTDACYHIARIIRSLKKEK